MRELEYPFDSKLLMRKRKSLKTSLLNDGSKRISKNIAVLGGSTTNDIVDILELFLLNYGIESNFYQSEYNKFWEDSVFENPVLDAFQPDIIYIHTTNKNINNYPSIQDEKSIIDEKLSAQYEHFRTMWESLTLKYKCPIIQNNFEFPYVRVIGNMSSYILGGVIILQIN